MGSAYLLPRVVGFGRATELLLLGDTVDAETALRYGLATRVVDDERLADEARALAEQLAAGPGLAYASTKALLTRELDLDLTAAIELEAQTQAALLGSRDHREFHASFVEQREPRFEGR
jgi:enoyl-CoA hydratase/carnithine racemase